MNQDWSIDENDWQGVDDEPIARSKNLVESGGVANELSPLKSKTSLIETEVEQGVEDEILFSTDNDYVVGRINEQGADFKNLKCNGKEVLDNSYPLENETSYPLSDEEIVIETDDEEEIAKFTSDGAFFKDIYVKNGEGYNKLSEKLENKVLYSLDVNDLSLFDHSSWSVSGELLNNGNNYGWSNMLLLNREYHISDFYYKFDFSIGSGGVAYFGALRGQDSLTSAQSLISVDFGNGKLSIHENPTSSITPIKKYTSISYTNYVNEKFRLMIERKDRKLIAKLLSLKDYSVVGELEYADKIALLCWENNADTWLDTNCGAFTERPFVFSTGAGMSVYDFSVNCPISVNGVKMIIYGDSITEGLKNMEGYSHVWSYMVANMFGNGRVLVSGRSGGDIKGVKQRIMSEASVLRPEYIMVTIGTNTGNTEENLKELVDLIISYNAKPILNHVPRFQNSVTNSAAVNSMIDTVIAYYKAQDVMIPCCKMDIATSVGFDISNPANTSLFIDGTHPNSEGSELMFKRVLIDISNLFNF